MNRGYGQITPLRRINQLIDFDFTYKAVAESYGINGKVSVPPPVILKLTLLLILYNVRSERELMATIAERIHWIWFLGLDSDEPIPGHSVLSKAGARWRSTTFKSFIERNFQPMKKRFSFPIMIQDGTLLLSPQPKSTVRASSHTSALIRPDNRICYGIEINTKIRFNCGLLFASRASCGKLQSLT